MKETAQNVELTLEEKTKYELDLNIRKNNALMTWKRFYHLYFSSYENMENFLKTLQENGSCKDWGVYNLEKYLIESIRIKEDELVEMGMDRDELGAIAVKIIMEETEKKLHDNELVEMGMDRDELGDIAVKIIMEATEKKLHDIER